MKTLKAVVLSLTLVGGMQAMDAKTLAALVTQKSIEARNCVVNLWDGGSSSGAHGSIFVFGVKAAAGALAYHKWVWPHVQTVVTKSGNVVAAGVRPLYNVGAAGAGKLYDATAAGWNTSKEFIVHYAPVAGRFLSTKASQGGKIVVQGATQGAKLTTAVVTATGKLASNAVHAVQDEYNELNRDQERSRSPQVTAQEKREEEQARKFRDRFGAK